MLNSSYCGLHLHKNIDSSEPVAKAAGAVAGVVLHTITDTNTLNSGFELTSDLVRKCDTKIGKGVVAVTGVVATEAASIAVQGLKHIGTVVKLFKAFDSL